MDLRSGSRLGPYEILAPIGAGGMGEVYRARDSRLGRTVAIKILPAAFASDAKLRIRFDREAKAISALNHPHICSLFDVGECDSLRYLVLEYCAGTTLAERVSRGPLPVDEALKYGDQIADALARAHKEGIVHRDLKPSNVMLTASGVKIVDFGLAVQQLETGADESGANSSTIERPVTEQGQFVGTLQYAAPEVLTTGHSDTRSDIYALGLILHEMLTGRPAFTATTRASLIAAILEHEPELIVRDRVSPQLANLVNLCLRKNPDERWQTAADVRTALQWVRTSGADGPDRSRPGGRTAVLAYSLPAVAGLLVIIATLLFLASRKPRATATAPAKSVLSVMITEPPLALRNGVPSIAVSPSGDSIVYVAGEPQRLFLRRLASSSDSAIAGSEGASQPFFSPDGQWIGFMSTGRLKKVSAAGGIPQAICNIAGIGASPGIAGATWGANDTIVYSSVGSLYAVHSNGGRPVQVTVGGANVLNVWPSFIGDTNQVLFAIADRPDRNESLIARLDLATKKVTPVMRGGNQPHYSPTGHLLFVRTGPVNIRTGTIFSVSYNPTTGASGPVTPRVTDVQSYPMNATAYWAIGNDGTAVYLPYDRSSVERELVWINRQGHIAPATDRLAYYNDVMISPDGRQFAFSDVASVWVGDLTRKVWLRISEDALYAQEPVWSPDGTRVVYSSDRGLYVAPADGGKAPRILMETDALLHVTSWSPDGRSLLFLKSSKETKADIWSLEVATGRSLPIVATAAYEATATFSPDGQWIAYTFFDTIPGDAQIAVERFHGPSGRQVVFSGAPCSTTRVCWIRPRWSHDGRELFFNAGKKMMAVDITTSGDFSAGPPRVLFETSDRELLDTFDVSPDGQTFLVARWKREPRWDHLNVATGWWAEK